MLVFWGEVLFSIQVPFTWKYPFSFVEMSIQKSTAEKTILPKSEVPTVRPVGFTGKLCSFGRFFLRKKLAGAWKGAKELGVPKFPSQ